MRKVLNTLITSLFVAVLLISCSPDQEAEEIVQVEQVNTTTYKYELGFLQKFRNYYSTLTVTSNEPTTSITFESGEGSKVEGYFTASGGVYQLNLTDIPITPSEASFYLYITETITAPNGDIISENILHEVFQASGTHTAWLYEYNVNTNVLTSTPQ